MAMRIQPLSDPPQATQALPLSQATRQSRNSRVSGITVEAGAAADPSDVTGDGASAPGAVVLSAASRPQALRLTAAAAARIRTRIGFFP